MLQLLPHPPTFLLENPYTPGGHTSAQDINMDFPDMITPY